MSRKSFKFFLNNWEFIVFATNEQEAIEKLRKELEKLVPQDGYTMRALQALEKLNNKNYEIEEYEGFIVGRSDW